MPGRSAGQCARLRANLQQSLEERYHLLPAIIASEVEGGVPRFGLRVDDRLSSRLDQELGDGHVTVECCGVERGPVVLRAEGDVKGV